VAVIAAMLEVYYVAAVKRRKLMYACKLLCAELHTSSKYTVCNQPWHKSYQIYAFKSLFLHMKYTSNMAACYDNDVNDVTAPRVHPAV